VNVRIRFTGTNIAIHHFNLVAAQAARPAPIALLIHALLQNR
jgi:hypothetical protein